MSVPAQATKGSPTRHPTNIQHVSPFFLEEKICRPMGALLKQKRRDREVSLEELVAGLGIIYVQIAPICPV